MLPDKEKPEPLKMTEEQSADATMDCSGRCDRGALAIFFLHFPGGPGLSLTNKSGFLAFHY